MKSPSSPSSLQYWKHLAFRYFEAETSLEEEQALRRFLATPEAQDPDFDELRATMCYISVGKERYQSSSVTRTSRRPLRWVSAAAVAVLIPLLSIPFLPSGNVCESYVCGEYIADADIVMQQVRQSFRQVQLETDYSDVTQDLNDIFETFK